MHDKEVFKHGIPPGKTMLGTEGRDPETGAMPSDTPIVTNERSPLEANFYNAIEPVTDAQVVLQDDQVRMNGVFTIDQLRILVNAFDEYLNVRR